MTSRSRHIAGLHGEVRWHEKHVDPIKASLSGIKRVAGEVFEANGAGEYSGLTSAQPPTACVKAFRDAALRPLKHCDHTAG